MTTGAGTMGAALTGGGIAFFPAFPTLDALDEDTEELALLLDEEDSADFALDDEELDEETLFTLELELLETAIGFDANSSSGGVELHAANNTAQPLINHHVGLL